MPVLHLRLKQACKGTGLWVREKPPRIPQASPAGSTCAVMATMWCGVGLSLELSSLSPHHKLGGPGKGTGLCAPLC